jgi:hypothetical protein
MLQLDPHREIVAINFERNVDILLVQIRVCPIIKVPDSTTGQDKASNRVRIARPASEPISQVDGAQFVLVSSVDAIVAHGRERDHIG